MENKLIAVWGAGPQVGCKTVARAMAARLADQGRNVLVVTVSPSNRQDGLEWVDRFKLLSPTLLRNYLSTEAESFARLELGAMPSAAASQELISLFMTAFEWVFWVSPVDWSIDTLAMLDHSTLLLWVAHPGETSQENLRRYFERLTALHYPSDFSQVVLNQIPLESFQSNASLQIAEGRTALAHIPQEHPRGMLFSRGIDQILKNLPVKSASIAPKFSDDKAIEEIKNRIQPQLIQDSEAPPAAAAQKTLEACLAKDTSLPKGRPERERIFVRVMEDVLGLGPLEPLLKDPEVSEILVNGQDVVFVEKRGKLHPCDARFTSNEQLRTLIDRIVAPIGRRVDESSPLCDARLPDGSRVNIVLPPLALDGPYVTIRKFRAKPLSLDELVQRQSLTQEMADFLNTAVTRRCNIVVSGGTGSGKTTLLNALSGLIPDDERIATIEDAAELKLLKPHVVRLESRPPNAEGQGAVPIRSLVMNALRMRPDRIVVGECRGGEALDMLQAMNTGHAGSLTTLHANSPRDALRRLETLVLMAGLDLPLRVVREQVQSAIDLVIQQARLADGSRKIISITEVTGLEGDTLSLQELFRYYAGRFEKTGIASNFFEDTR